MMETQTFTSGTSPLASIAPFLKPAPLRKFRTTLDLLPSNLRRLQSDSSAPGDRSTTPPPNLHESSPALTSKPAPFMKQKTTLGCVGPNWRTKTAVVQPSNGIEFRRQNISLLDDNSSRSSESSDWSSIRSTNSADSWTSSISANRSFSSFNDPDSIVRSLATHNHLRDLPLDLYVAPETIMVDFNNQDSMVIGEGGQGKIFKAWLADEEVAVKMSESSQVLEEFILINQMRHRCIIRPIAFSVARTGGDSISWDDAASTISDVGLTFMAVYEYCINGDLGSYLQNHPEKADDDEYMARVFDNILEALAHVHKHHHLHTDIKPDNILVTQDGSVRLADFGMCQRFSDRMIAQGTPSYLPPEMVAAWHTHHESHRYSGASDIFSFGVLMVNTLTGKYPFARITARLRRGISLTPSEMKAIFTPPSKRFHELESINPTFAVVAKLCLRVDPSERPEADFLRHVLASKK